MFIIFKLFFRIQVSGKENIPSHGAFILASNHSSYLDPPILAVSCFGIRQLHFLAKEELFRNRLFGWFIKKLNAFPIRRTGSDISAIKECIKRIRDGQALVIFPEGGRSDKGKLQDGLPGIALIAIKTNIPVVPVFIRGADKALSPGSKLIKRSKIQVRFGEPFFVDKDNSNTYFEITNKIMLAIENLSHSF